jgi:hypothetical protein
MSNTPQLSQVGDREYTPTEWAEAMRAERYLEARCHMEYLWNLVKPLKFPAPPRRRRDDPQLPKAA